MEIKEMIQTIHEEKQSIGGIQQVIWLAAGGRWRKSSVQQQLRCILMNLN